MSQQFVETSGIQMRRRVAALASQQVRVSAGHNINVVRIYAKLADPPPPPTVPFEDPGSSARERSSAHLRVLIRPAGVGVAQTATYIGKGSYVVRI